MQVFFGIDQIGGTDSRKGKPKPLPAASLAIKRDGIDLKLGTIASLSPSALEDFCGRALSGDSLILVDAVLWPLVGRGSAGLWDGFKAASLFSLEGKEYGLKVGEAFFSSFLNLPQDSLKSSRRASLSGSELSFRVGTKQREVAKLTKVDQIPRRKCELLARANSVFCPRPYQRNVQTGTFRIWKDLGRGGDPGWCEVWPFDRLTGRKPVVAEGYPSLMWRTILGLATRDLSQLKNKLKKKYSQARVSAKQWKMMDQDPNLADALVLALAGATLWEQALPPPVGVAQETLMQEGWIFGLTKK